MKINGEQPSRGPIRFGLFEVDLRAGELRRQGVKIKLQEQPLQILAMLLEHPGEVVTREELRNKLWPADTFVDFDHGLNKSINKLREALGDSADNPRFIETLAKRGYRFIRDLAARARPIESLVVLPLENLSRDPEQEYFAEGLTEALINTLAKIGALRVVSRTTAMHYKGVHKPLPEIARELQVDAVVEGTVLRSRDRVRISAQLVDARADTHLWAESYDRDLRDVLALQSDVAQAIAREVQIKLTPQERAHFAHVHAVDPEAYEAYLKGRYHWNRRSGEGLGKAVDYFQQAIAKDPTYAAAYSGLADSLCILGALGFASPQESCGKAKGLAVQALETDPGLAEAHTSLAWVNLWYDYDFAASERGFERSLELNPRYPTAHEWFGFYLGLMGRHEEAYTELKRAIRLDEQSTVIQWAFGFVLWCARRYDQAIAQLEKTLELEPAFAQAHVTLGWTYSCQLQYHLAIPALQKGIELSKGLPSFIACLGEAYAAAGYHDEARKILDQLQELSSRRYVTPYPVSRIYAALGQRDETFRWLEAAYRDRAAWMTWLKIDPRFDELRSDPRFQDLLRRMNFPEA